MMRRQSESCKPISRNGERWRYANECGFPVRCFPPRPAGRAAYDNAIFRPEPTLPLLPINPAKWIHITGESERVAKSMPRHGTEFRDEASSPCAPSILMLIGVA